MHSLLATATGYSDHLRRWSGSETLFVEENPSLRCADYLERAERAGREMSDASPSAADVAQTLPAPATTTPRLAWRRAGVYALLLFVVTAWGGSFVAARMLLAPSAPSATALSPTMLAAVRFLLAAALLAPALVRQHRRVRRITRRDLLLFLALGQLSISVYFWLQYTGVRLTNAGIASVLVVGLIPLATLLVARVALREPLGWRRALALALGLVGVGVVVSQSGLRLQTQGGFLLGALCLAADALCFAVYTTLIRGVRTRYPPLTITAGMTFGGALGLVLLALVTGGWASLTALSPIQWLAIAYLGVVCSVLAYLAYNYALARIEASRAAVWIYLEPPVAVALGALLLGEPVTLPMVAGGLVIVASLYLVHKS